jgi:hypothetical protein
MRASPLCDGMAFTRHLEAAYRDMWQRWVSNGECLAGPVGPPLCYPGRSGSSGKP